MSSPFSKVAQVILTLVTMILMVDGQVTTYSFESPTVVNYEYDPPMSSDNPWTYYSYDVNRDEGSGIGHVGGSFDGPVSTPPDGNQYAFIRTSISSSISIGTPLNNTAFTTSSTIGLSFWYSAIAAFPGPVTTADLLVRVGPYLYGTITDTIPNVDGSNGWTLYSTNFTGISYDSDTYLAFQSNENSGYQWTVLVDDIVVAQCPPGTSLAYASGVPTCVACPAGSFSTTWGATSCVPCPAGQYQGSSGSTTCSVCPDNTISSAGSTSSGDCQPCPSGSSGGGIIPVCCSNGVSLNGQNLAKLVIDSTRLATGVACLLNGVINDGFLETVLNKVCGADAGVGYGLTILNVVNEAQNLQSSLNQGSTPYLTGVYCN